MLNDKSQRREYATKLVLMSVFVGGLFLFIGYMTFYGPGWDAFKLGTMDLVLLSLAVYRLGRLVAYDRVMEPLRQFFARTIPDPTGAGDTTEARGEGIQQSIGQLVTCPVCVGTWIAAGLVYLLYLFPSPVRVFLAMTAVAGAAELLVAVTEALCWTGQYGRVMSGYKMREQERQQYMQIELPNQNNKADAVQDQHYYHSR
jgi:hypothetical protein